MDYSFALSPSGKYIHFVPTRPACTEAELIRRWSQVMALGRRERVYRALFDHRQCPPPTNVDMISAALRHPEWREGERWRIAMLLSPQLVNAARLQLEGVAEFVSAIEQEAEVFWEPERAEEWLTFDSA